MVHFRKQFMIIAVACLFSTPCLGSEWVYVEDISGNPQGGILIRYPDLAEAQVHNLSQQLRHHGWSSLLIPLPMSMAGSDPAVNTEQPIVYIKEQHGQHNLVLLALGDTWDETLSLAETEDDEGNTLRPIQAVVLIDVPGEFGATPNIPTLDITTTARPVEGYEQRQLISRRDGVETNQGITLRYATRRSPGQREDFLTRRIRSWLHHNARGMEITEVEP